MLKNRKMKFQAIAVLGIGLAWAGWGSAPGGPFGQNGLPAREGDAPNIIFIVTDDQGYADLGAYEFASPGCNTPQMDRIAKKGVLFTQAYAAAPVCSPSRAALYTGRYHQRWDSAMYWTPGLPENVPTLAERLKAHGYATARVGKSDYGQHFHDPTAREFPLNHGYDFFLGFSAHAHDYQLLDETIEKATPDPYGWSESLGRLFRNDRKESFENTYTTKLFTDEAIAFIREHQNEPFFLDLSYNAVHHLIHEVPAEYLRKWGLPGVASYDPSYGTYAQYYWDYTQVGKISDGEMRRYYLANLNCLDDQIGRLLDVLDELGLRENTLIVFLSDNGGEPLSGANNLPLAGSKYTMYEGGIRVPFMLSWPASLPRKQVYRHRVSALDLVPTCLEAAGIDPGAAGPFDGVSLLDPVRRNEPSAAAGKPLYFKFEKHHAVIDKGWKLVYTENYNPDNRPITSQILLGRHENQTALYDLTRDPAERNNLLEEEPAKAGELERLFQEWLAEMRADHSNYH